MTRTHSFSSAKSTRRLASGLLVACCVAVPALAQEAAPQPETAFGQPMPRQYFLNQLTNPAHDPAPGQGAAAGAGQAGGGQAGGAGRRGRGQRPVSETLSVEPPDRAIEATRSSCRARSRPPRNRLESGVEAMFYN